jgi:chitinase
MLISVGGWTWSDKFFDVALTDESRRSLPTVSLGLLSSMVGGVDLDWKHPVSGGLSSNTTRPEDKTNFTLLMAKLREKLDEQGRLDECHCLLTFAGAAGENTELNVLSNYVDFATVMTYDMHGSWEGCYTV